MNNNNKTESATQETAATTTGHLEAFLYRVPKKNHDAIAQNLKKFVPWFKKNGVGIEYYQLGNYKTMEGMESIAKTLSAAEDEDIWMELQYFRDRKHCEDVYAKMMKDKSIEPLGNEFFGLITQGKSLVTGGFSRLRE
ncbi:DUF1428 family protein [Nitrososphaera viennensis]|uniref:DUF1428 domain-containing protein n=2 Tax=Nitrososphaera viennensis TaxID=1034015 RepID=A0A060HK66_9ARCH|nr:DUF1428 family protein [Nitrososphaera viennensis]AIC15690.1 hypothetical protein NVIE_014490 [Nitrososphaera viennensis EN76]UVS70563.1 DUF1428 family protein [Nitrososphaera viennensis]